MTRKALSVMSVAALVAAALLLVASTPAWSSEVVQAAPEVTSTEDVNPLMPGRRLLGGKCAKCKVPVAQGGCKCKKNCDCIGGPTTTPPPAPKPSGNVLYSGNSSASFFYDVNSWCPGVSGNARADGYPACTSLTPGPTQQTLRQLGSNNAVAIDTELLFANRTRYCGKKVLVFKNGKQVAAPDGGDFFVWDSCDACRGGGRIDLSVSGMRNVDPNACKHWVVPGVTFQVVDVQVRRFVP